MINYKYVILSTINEAKVTADILMIRADAEGILPSMSTNPSSPNLMSVERILGIYLRIYDTVGYVEELSRDPIYVWVITSSIIVGIGYVRSATDID